MYYTVLAAVVVWGIIALKLAAPVMLLQIGANIAGLVFIIASMHVLYLNTRILPVALRPPMWRRVALVCMALFYGVLRHAGGALVDGMSRTHRPHSSLLADLDPVPDFDQHRIHVARRTHARAISIRLLAHAFRQQHVVRRDDAAGAQLGVNQLEAR